MHVSQSLCSHAVKDPIKDDIVIQKRHKIILVEGLYLLLDQPVWRDIADCFDERWFIECDKSVARERIAKRHVASGLASDVQRGYERFDANDGINADVILANSLKPSVTVISVNEGDAAAIEV